MFIKQYPKYFYTSDGTRIFYNTNFETFNQKKPLIVFVYGLLCSNFHFKFQIPYFEKLGFQIITHDYRWHFSSSQNIPIEKVTFPLIAQDLYELLNQFPSSQNILIGHSMGVNICLEFAQLYPECTSKMVLISGAVVPPQKVMFDSRMIEIVSPIIKKFTELYPSQFQYIWRNAFKNPLLQYAIFDGGFNKEKVDIEFIQTYMKKISELPEDLFFHLLELMRDHDIKKDLHKIKCETLLIGGDKDKIIPNYLQRDLRDAMPNALLYIVKNGSHVPQADFPDEINEVILSFMD